MDSFLAALKRVAPWAIGAAILWWLFDRVPIADAWSAARDARLLEFVLVTSVAVTAWWLLESRAFAGATALPESPVTGPIQRTAAIADGLAIAMLVVLMTDRPRWTWLSKFRSAGIFSSHRQATLADVAVLSAIRFCYFGGFVLYFWLGTWAFNAPVPLLFAMASTPIILVVQSLPITPAGLGTQQAAMLYFFAPYAAEAPVLAFSLAFPVALIVTRLPLGLLYIRDLAALRASRREA